MRVLQNTMREPALVLGILPDNRLVAGGSGGFDVWGPAGEKHSHLPGPKVKEVRAFAFDYPGRLLYYSVFRVGCLIVSLDGGGSSTLPGESHVLALAASPNGARLAASRGTMGWHRISCLDLEGGECREEWSVAESERAPTWRGPLDFFSGWFSYSLAFSPDGRTLGTLEGPSGARSITLRDAADGARRGRMPLVEPEEGYAALPILFTPDGGRIVCLLKRRLDLWDVGSLARSASVKAPGSGNLRAMAMHPSGRFFATAGGDGVVRYWHPETLRELKSYKWGVGKLHSVAFSPDGTLGAAGGDKGRVALWDVDD